MDQVCKRIVKYLMPLKLEILKNLEIIRMVGQLKLRIAKLMEEEAQVAQEM